MNHPSGLITTDYEPCEVYEPNRLQIANAARRAKDKYPLPPKPFPWLALLAVVGGFGGLLMIVFRVI